MLIATWILAVSTGILAIGGPIAFLTWWRDRAADRERRQREREQEARDRVLRDASDRFMTKADASEKFIAKNDAGKEFVPKNWVAGGVVFGSSARCWPGRPGTSGRAVRAERL
jgi:hypothetical protein